MSTVLNDSSAEEAMKLIFVASVLKIGAFNKDVLDSERTLTSCALRLVCTSKQIRRCRLWTCV